MSKKSKLRIAFILESFPYISGHSILNQMISLLKEGHQIDIFPSLLIKEEIFLTGVLKFESLVRIFYPPSIPKNKFLIRIKCLFFYFKNLGHIEKIDAILSLNFSITRKRKLFLRIVPFLGKEEYDIIHCHFGTSAIAAIYARTFGMLKGKSVISFYGYDAIRFPLDENFYKYIIQHFDHLIVLSHFLENKVGLNNYNYKKTSVIPLVVDLEIFKPKENGKKIKILTVSEFIEESGIYYAIIAFSKIHENFKNVEYNILGSGVLYDKYKNMIKSLDLENKVYLIENVERREIEEYYNESDIFIAPYVSNLHDNPSELNKILFESDIVKLPVICSLCYGISEGVVDGETGFIVPERNTLEISNKLKILLENNELRETMKKSASKFSFERLHLDELRKKLLEVYTS